MNRLHQFHIPVMGLSFTIDSPVKVARYGIASTISIIEDRLVELMRSHYYKQRNESYIPISVKEDDYRAKRITDYLNLVNRIVQEQIETVRISAFEVGSEISKYMEMLPARSEIRQMYERMMVSPEPEKIFLQNKLRGKISAGAIDVNIMTKVDKENPGKTGEISPYSSDALAALRGYAKSTLTNSSVIFSAGMNPRLYNYLEQLNEFDAYGHGLFRKKIVIKVSDYRSALIQGKFLAKKGVWVSEFRIESGLNCGGHAFASDGSLLGPILDEFKTKRQEFIQTLFQLYKPIAEEKTGIVFTEPHPVQITVQGGIGTNEEAEFLIHQYNIDSVGWGTPFLLCPEATTVDDETLKLLSQAKQEDVILSKNSPLGIRFNYLKGTSAEKERLDRIREGKPGSPCTEKHLVSNTEFTTDPICTASHKYQVKKIAQLNGLNLSEAEYKSRYNDIVSKECLCIGLSNSVLGTYGLSAIKKLKSVTICPGPNIAYFNQIVTLRQMTDHIYGRINLLEDTDRPHMFVKELQLNIEFIKEKKQEMEPADRKLVKYVLDFLKQLTTGIEYYRSISDQLKADECFNATLDSIELEIKKVQMDVEAHFQIVNVVKV